jgi:hypothetical protein
MIFGMCGAVAVVPVASQIGRHGEPRRQSPPVWLGGGVPEPGGAYPGGPEAAFESNEVVGAAPAAPPTGSRQGVATAPAGRAVVAAAPRTTPAGPISPSPVPPAAIRSGPTASGVASWLNTIPAGTCANNAAPMGSVISVANLEGVTVTCTVVSRGPFVAGRIVDLAEPTFAHLGSVSQGLVSVTVTW